MTAPETPPDHGPLLALLKHLYPAWHIVPSVRRPGHWYARRLDRLPKVIKAAGGVESFARTSWSDFLDALLQQELIIHNFGSRVFWDTDY